MKAKKNARTILYHAFVVIFGLIMIYPVIWMILSSFKTKSEILGANAPFLPTTWVWENYTNGWKGAGQYTFATYFKTQSLSLYWQHWEPLSVLQWFLIHWPE